MNKNKTVKMVAVPLDALAIFLNSSAKTWQEAPKERAILAAAVKAAK